MVYFPFPPQSYFSYHPYYHNNLCYYPNPPPLVDHHYYPQAASDPAAAVLFPGVPISYSAAGDGGADVVVEAAADRHYGGNRNRGGMPGRFTSGPRSFFGRGSNFGRCRVKKVWKPKEAPSPPPPPPPPRPRSRTLRNCTTLMIRNIPNSLSRGTLIDLLESHCREQNKIAEEQSSKPCRSEFDFLYLPFDFIKWRNLGYAFVNFTSVEGASRLHSCWNGIGWEGCPKIREITRAKLQGKERCKKHFQISVFECHSEEYLPVLFSPPGMVGTGMLPRWLTLAKGWIHRQSSHPS